MADKWIEQLLKDVAFEIAGRDHWLESQAVLTARLASLLEIGQAMRMRDGSGSVVQEFGYLERLWDTAKQKALEPRDGR